MKNTRKILILSIAVIFLATGGIFGAPGSDSDQNEKTLEYRIYKRILTMPYYGVFDNIEFELDGDAVTLSGKVYTASNRKTAERLVLKLDGVGNVVNNIEVLPPSRFDDGIRRRTVRSFANTGGLYRYLMGTTPSVRIIVDRGHLTLEGYVSGAGDIRLANILAKGIPGVFSVTNNLMIGDPEKY